MVFVVAAFSIRTGGGVGGVRHVVNIVSFEGDGAGQADK